MRFVDLESGGFLKDAFERTRPGFRDRHVLEGTSKNLVMLVMLVMLAMMEKLQKEVMGG
jgi:hypothetical protein